MVGSQKCRLDGRQGKNGDGDGDDDRDRGGGLPLSTTIAPLARPGILQDFCQATSLARKSHNARQTPIRHGWRGEDPQGCSTFLYNGGCTATQVVAGVRSGSAISRECGERYGLDNARRLARQ